MKRLIILTLTAAILGIIYPVLSNIQTNAETAKVFDGYSVVEIESGATSDVVLSNATDETPTTQVEEDARPVVVEPVVSETVITEPVYQEPVYQEPVYQEPVYQEPVYQEPEPVYQAPAPAPAPAPEPIYTAPVTQSDHIEVAGNWVNVYNVNSTALDAGNSVYRFINGSYDGRFLYGHNSWNVFGGLVNLGIGSTFTLTLDNVTTTYAVSNIVIFEKNQSTGKLQLGGEGSYMNNVARAKHNGTQYDLSLMTCHGQSLGHGDATHRLVIFANKI